MAFCNEHILSLQVSVQHFVLVDVLQPKAQLDKPLQYLKLGKALFAVLGLLNASVHVSSLAEVHHNVDVLFFDKRVVVLDHVCMVEASEDFDLVVDGNGLLSGIPLYRDSFESKEVAICSSPDEMDHAIGATSNLVKFFVPIHIWDENDGDYE